MRYVSLSGLRFREGIKPEPRFGLDEIIKKEKDCGC